MTRVDLLSDTTYREQAVKQLDLLLSSSTKFPVKTTQIYGLRQIARQEPGKVKKFPKHQGKRAHRKQSSVSNLQTLKDIQAEIDFWILVFDLCGDETPGYLQFNISGTASNRQKSTQERCDEEKQRWEPREYILQDLQAEIDFWTCVLNRVKGSTPDWSVLKEGHLYLPEELREENLPDKSKGATQQETQAKQQRYNQFKSDQKEWLDQWENEHIPAFFERFCTHCLYHIAKLEMQAPN